jgi:hypothetical protein
MKRHTHLSAAPKAARSPSISPLALSVSLLACSAIFSFHLWPANPALASPQPRAANASPAELPVVYVSDFELDILRGGVVKTTPPRNSPGTTSGARAKVPSASPSTTLPGNPPSSSPDKPAPPAATVRPEPKEDPATQEANELVTAMAENLVSALEKAGYTVRRLRASEALPKVGLRIRGVFAEPDEQNRIRRLLVGSGSTSPNILLYVGVNNLAQPEQPLYELANPPSNDGKHGPVITVTSYSPAVRFELARNPSDEELKKVAAQIAADLTGLVNANPLARIQ